MKPKSSTTLIVMFLCTLYPTTCKTGIVKDLIQFNVAGHPVLHKNYEWDFDPDAGRKRSKEYQEVNGSLGEIAIQRLGLGLSE